MTPNQKQSLLSRFAPLLPVDHPGVERLPFQARVIQARAI
jgi:hypothetical protein